MSDSQATDSEMDSSAAESLRLANQKVPFTKVDFMSLIFLFGGGAQMLWVGGPQIYCGQRAAAGEAKLMFPERKYFMTGMTNNLLEFIPIKMYKDVACALFEDAQMKYGGPGGQMISLVGMMSPIGLAFSCPMMEICRLSMMQRCYYFDQVEFAHIMYTTIVSFSVGCFTLTTLLLILARKKKFRLYTALLGAFGALVAALILGWWLIIHDEMLMALASISPYPYAMWDGCGYNGMLIGQSLMCLGCCCGCCGVLPEKQPDSESENEWEGIDMSGAMGGGAPEF
jgi:hypothetical protein